ncbi:substrate-binding periplasmic protein [Pseudoalteromonas sp.]|uniref:substrate-binding periplasmic protein n=1 Tax=Pseudoalteromonas sp. TaxID=53249 RepID=UPI0035648CD1
MKFFCLLLFFVSSPIHANIRKVDIYTYHDMPPYIINLKERSGLYFDFVDLLNQMNSGYTFNLIYMPRKRLDYRLEQNKLDGIVIGVNPKWFKDASQTRFLWSPVIMQDKDVFVSLKQNPIEVHEFKDLKGKRVGGIRGFRYIGIDELATQQIIERVDTQTESQLFDMLKKERIDTAILSIYTFYYLSENNTSDYHIAAKQHDAFKRHFLIPKSDNKMLHVTLSNILSSEEFTKYWNQRLDNYSMQIH